MKFTIGLAAIALLLATAANAAPTEHPNEEVELLNGDGEVRRPTAGRPVFTIIPISPFGLADESDADSGVFNVDSISVPVNRPSNPFNLYNPFNSFNSFDFGFANRLNDILRALTSQNGAGGSMVPNLEGTDDESKDTDTSVAVDGDSDENPKTTSVVKIVNGHKYEINETISTRNTPFGQSVFKVRTVNILPVDESDEVPATSSTTDTPARDSPTTEESSDITGTTDEENIDRGSPELLEPDHRRNEIGYRQPSDRIEVLRL